MLWVGVFVGCQSIRDDPEYFFSFGHFSKDAPAFDVYVDGRLLVEDVSRREVTGFIELPVLPERFELTEAGTLVPLLPPIPPRPIPGGGRQNVFLIGLEADETLTLLRYNQADNRPEPDRVRVVAAHGVSDLDLIDFLLDGELVSRRVEFLDASVARGARGGLVETELRRTIDGLKIETAAWDLPPDEDYSLLLLGQASGIDITAAMIRDRDGMVIDQASRLRFLHVDPFVDRELQFFLDGELADSEVRFAAGRRYVAVLPGSYEVSARVRGTDSEPVPLGTVDVRPGEDFTLPLVADAASGDPQLLRIPDPDVPGRPGRARVRFLHAAPEIGEVQISVAEEVVAESVSYLDGFDYVRVDSGDRRFDVVEVATGRLVEGRRISFTQGEDFTVVLAGLEMRDGNEPPLELTRLRDDIDP